MRMNKLVLAATALIFALSANALVMDAAVATVNGKPILQSDFDKVSKAFLEQYEIAAPKLMDNPSAKLKLEKEILEQMINDELLFQAADAQGIKARDQEVNEALENAKKTLIPPTDAKGKEISDKERNKQFSEALKKEGISLAQFKDRLKKQIVSRKFVETVIVSKITPVTEEDAKKLYDEVKAVMDKNTKKIAQIKPAEHKAEVEAIAQRLTLLSAAKVKFGHIFIAVAKDAKPAEIKEKEAKAKEIKKQIDGGLNFTEAVMKYSDDPSKTQTGGDMVLAKGAAPKALDDKIFTLDVGKISDPVRTEAGYSIVRIKEKAASEDVTFEKVAREFGQYIAAQKIQAAITEHIKQLNEKAEIKINKDFSALEMPADTKKEEPKK